MITSKLLSLSLLLISCVALARVQFHVEFKDLKRYPDSTKNVAFQIDAGESLEVYDLDNIKVVAELLAEEEATATARFTMYGKNNAGQYEQVLSPVLVVNYTESGVYSLDSTEGESITMTVQAQKV